MADLTGWAWVWFVMATLWILRVCAWPGLGILEPPGGLEKNAYFSLDGALFEGFWGVFLGLTGCLCGESGGSGRRALGRF